MKSQFKTIEQVWKAIDEGKTIYWSSSAYTLTIEPSSPNFDKFSERNNKVLRVTCTANYFGSLLRENDLSNLYIKEGAE